MGRQADDDSVQSAAGYDFVDGAKGDRLSIAGGNLVSEGSAQEVLIGAGEYQSFLLSGEVHHGFDLFLAGAGLTLLYQPLLYQPLTWLRLASIILSGSAPAGCWGVSLYPGFPADRRRGSF
jgi:hypothetical protein